MFAEDDIKFLSLAQSPSMGSINASMEVTTDTPMPEFVNFDQKYTCVLCKKLLVLPMQMPCGHRICEKCFISLKQAEHRNIENGIACPGEEEEDCEKMFPDKVSINIIILFPFFY